MADNLFAEREYESQFEWDSTPEPLESSPVMDFLSDQARFDDMCCDAIFCPGSDRLAWYESSNGIRCTLFRIQEARDNGMNDSALCEDLASLILGNIKRSIEDK
jgi:hypothetical protein